MIFGCKMLKGRRKMKARLKKVCKNCTESSLQTYYYNIKALARMVARRTA